jgi:amidase
MSFRLPTTDQVRILGNDLGMEVTVDYANGFINFIRPFADGFRLLASLPDDVPAIKYARAAYYRPQGDANTARGSQRRTSLAHRAAVSLVRRLRSRTPTLSPACR